MYLSDVESFVTSQTTHLCFLLLGEFRTVALVRHSIAHCIKENYLEFVHAEGNIQQSVINSCTDAVGAHKDLLREATAREVIVTTAFSCVCNVCCRVGQLADAERELTHLLHATFALGSNSDDCFCARR